MAHEVRQDLTCKVFSKKKNQIEKLAETLEKEYIVNQSSEIQWNEDHQDYEVWLYLLHKDSLGRGD